MHSCQLSLISKDSPEVQYNLVNWDPDNRNVLFNDNINILRIKWNGRSILLNLPGSAFFPHGGRGRVHNAHDEWTYKFVVYKNNTSFAHIGT